MNYKNGGKQSAQVQGQDRAALAEAGGGNGTVPGGHARGRGGQKAAGQPAV